MADDEPKPLTLDQVRAQLPRGGPTVYRLLDDGTLPSVKVGSRRYVRPSDLTRYLAGLDPADRDPAPRRPPSLRAPAYDGHERATRAR